MKNILYITTYYTKYTVNFFNNLKKIKNLNFIFTYPNLKKNIKINSHSDFSIREKKIFNYFEDKYEICYYKLYGLDNLIKKYKPKIIVVHNKHVLNFFLNEKLIKLKKEIGFQIYYRTIPYLIPQNKSSLSKFYNGKNFFKKFILNLKIIDLIVFKYYKFIFHKVDHFLTYVPQGQKIIKSYGIKNKNITTVYNTVDTFELDKIEKKLKKKIKKKYDIIYVGSLSRWKKVELLIDAAESLKKKYKIKILIVGDGFNKLKYMNMVKKKKLKNNILFEGSVHNKRKLYKLLKQSKIFVLPGPGGLAINEAMHAGLPIICSKADGTEKFLVKNKINGIFFKENSSLDLHKKLSSILQNKKLLITLGKNSKKIIDNNFNSHLINKNYEKAFKL